ncbi:hypothetical protein AUC68_10520 [Methyloceanibacter methanicus]|uniref:3',5'-cyclic-nucleotide phosphodiesterase n=1 Tax=Methyloceanibacter methanicus TaxID=1774968 RepID=A0A1E3VWN7_9HYPH|nr:hypothetical protein [Methyloceanibacter methanicus]ODR97945.1 hypothetical protein AUC68_10520 [Methyloceanibacter methanicus]
MGRFIIFALTVCLAGAAQLSAANASAYSEAVRKYCRADYKKYCGEYGLETNALRNCMDRNGDKLSDACVRALVQSGEVSQREVDRRRKKKTR